MNSKRLQGYRDLAMSVFVSIVGDGRTAQIFTRNTAILDLLARLEIAQEALEYYKKMGEKLYSAREYHEAAQDLWATGNITTVDLNKSSFSLETIENFFYDQFPATRAAEALAKILSDEEVK